MPYREISKELLTEVTIPDENAPENIHHQFAHIKLERVLEEHEYDDEYHENPDFYVARISISDSLIQAKDLEENIDELRFLECSLDNVKIHGTAINTLTIYKTRVTDLLLDEVYLESIAVTGHGYVKSSFEEELPQYIIESLTLHDSVAEYLILDSVIIKNLYLDTTNDNMTLDIEMNNSGKKVGNQCRIENIHFMNKLDVRLKPHDDSNYQKPNLIYVNDRANTSSFISMGRG